MVSRALGLVLLAVVLTGCGARHITVDGMQRGYRIHVPDTYTGTAPVPLLLALHQFSDTAAGMEKLTGFNRVADREGFIVVYPQGRFRIWRVGEDEGVDDVAFLETLIDALAAEYNIDPNRIYATGASAGGMMAQYLACKTSRFAAIATVMGSIERPLSETCAPARIPVLLMHGDADPVIPYAGGLTDAGPGRQPNFLGAAENAAWWAQINGCPQLPVAVDIRNPIAGDAATRVSYVCEDGIEVQFYTLIGGGHTWPGRNNWYPRFIVGPTSQAFDATEVIWAFLARHTR